MRHNPSIDAILISAALAAPALGRVSPPDPVVEPAAPAIIQRAGFDQKLGAQVPLDLRFRDETGAEVRLQDYFNDKPVLLSLAYYECPMLCTLVLNGIVNGLKSIPFRPGVDYQVVTVSFDHGETPELAAAKKKTYMEIFDRDGAEAGWHFLTGQPDQIEQLASAVGFRFAYDEKSDEYAHASGIMLATPTGRLSHYFYGVEYPGRDLRLGLVEASEGRIGSPVDQVLLFCYHYDPVTGTYSAAIMNIVRAGCLVTVAALALFLSTLWRKPAARPAKPEVIGAAS